MSQRGTLASRFPWGLLVISDAQSDLQVPDFASHEVPTSASTDAAVLRVMHDFEGKVLVRIWDDTNDITSLGTHPLDISLTVDISSGTLVVGDVERTSVVTASVQPGRYDIRISADALDQPELVDLVLVATPTPDSSRGTPGRAAKATGRLLP